jgi:hypothetical protein
VNKKTKLPKNSVVPKKASCEVVPWCSPEPDRYVPNYSPLAAHLNQSLHNSHQLLQQLHHQQPAAGKCSCPSADEHHHVVSRLNSCGDPVTYMDLGGSGDIDMPAAAVARVQEQALDEQLGRMDSTDVVDFGGSVGPIDCSVRSTSAPEDNFTADNAYAVVPPSDDIVNEIAALMDEVDTCHPSSQDNIRSLSFLYDNMSRFRSVEQNVGLIFSPDNAVDNKQQPVCSSTVCPVPVPLVPSTTSECYPTREQQYVAENFIEKAWSVAGTTFASNAGVTVDVGKLTFDFDFSLFSCCVLLVCMVCIFFFASFRRRNCSTAA